MTQTVAYKRFDAQYAAGDVTVIAFSCSPSCASNLYGEEGQRLVASADLEFGHFDFLLTKSDPSFFIHNLAIQHFDKLHAKLCQEKVPCSVSRMCVWVTVFVCPVCGGFFGTSNFWTDHSLWCVFTDN